MVHIHHSIHLHLSTFCYREVAPYKCKTVLSFRCRKNALFVKEDQVAEEVMSEEEKVEIQKKQDLKEGKKKILEEKKMEMMSIKHVKITKKNHNFTIPSLLLMPVFASEQA